MRRHCLEIFHYVGSQLKDKPLFESLNVDRLGPKVGAVFNDFEDRDFEEEDEVIISSQYECPTNSASAYQEIDLTDLVPQSLVDHAIVRADEIDGINYSQSVIESPSFDIEDSITSESYLKKVYHVLLKEFNEVDFNNETLQLYESRRRKNWGGPDTFYDAWLIAQLTPRPEFPYEQFKTTYPDVFEIDVKPYVEKSPKRFKPSISVNETITIISDTESE